MKRSWYTKLEDVKLAQTIITFIKNNPKTYKAEIERQCFISRQRLDKLSKEGYLFLPKNKRPPTIRRNVNDAKTKRTICE